MTELISAQIPNAQGPVNTGTGDQTQHFFPISLADAKGRSPRRQAADDLRELARRFVYPTGLGRARAILEEEHTVFLHAPPGSGGPPRPKCFSGS